jgi:23S rRNA-/tRNA-specific pseudouridylate synthase
VLFADALFLVVDKPAGLLSVPGKAAGAANAAALLDSFWVREKNGRAGAGAGAASIFRSARGAGLLAPACGELRPRVVHRLDEATSGLMLFPLSAGSLSAVAKLFVQRRVKKRYEALVDTRAFSLPEAGEGIISTPLAANSHAPVLQTADPASARAPLKPATSRWKLVEKGDGCARISLWPETGRTHQLRLHAALPPPLGLGAPIIGDPFYADPALCRVSYQLNILNDGNATERSKAAGDVSVTGFLKQLEARRREIGAVNRPLLPSCRLLESDKPAPRMMLAASELALPDDFGGHFGGDEAWGDDENLGISPFQCDVSSPDLESTPPSTPAALTITASREPWTRFGFRNSPTRLPAQRRVVRFTLPAPF